MQKGIIFTKEKGGKEGNKKSYMNESACYKK